MSDNEHYEARKQCVSYLNENGISNNNDKFILCQEDKKCAPGVKFEHGTCFTLAALKKIAHSFNKFLEERASASIKEKYMIRINNNKNNDEIKKQLVKDIDDRLKGICKDQTEWLKLNIVKKLKDKGIEKYTFRPPLTNKRFDWLSTIDINHVLDQYELRYPDFKSFGAVPYDFSELSYLDLYNLDIDKYYKEGKYKWGIVFNLDTSRQPGSHWVSMFVNLKEGQIYFFDSGGKKPRKRIADLVNKIKIWMEKKYNGRIKMDVNYNNIRHQYENSECGVYSINFITELLKGNNFMNIIKNKIDDRKINLKRDLYFRFDNENY